MCLIRFRLPKELIKCMHGSLLKRRRSLKLFLDIGNSIIEGKSRFKYNIRIVTLEKKNTVAEYSN